MSSKDIETVRNAIVTQGSGSSAGTDAGGSGSDKMSNIEELVLRVKEKLAAGNSGVSNSSSENGKGSNDGVNTATGAVIPSELNDVAEVVNKISDEISLEGWADMTTQQQRNALKHSGLSDQEQWLLLNASSNYVETIAKVQDIYANSKDYDLTYTEANDICKELIKIAQAREDTQSEAGQFRFNARGKDLFLRQLDEREEKLLAGLTKPANDTGNNSGYTEQNGVEMPTTTPSPFQPPTTPHPPQPGPSRIPVTPTPYPEKAKTAYVFYTDSKGAEFSKQAQYQKRTLEKQGYQVVLVCTNDVTKFSEAWNNMDPKTGAAVILSHSNGMSLMFEDGSATNAISATGKNRAGKTIPAISDLSGPELAVLYIYACNSGHEELFETAGTNVADAFRDLSNVDTVYAYDGSVGFGIPFLGTNWENLLFPRLSLDQDSYYGMLPSHALPGNSGVPSGLVEYRSED